MLVYVNVINVLMKDKVIESRKSKRYTNKNLQQLVQKRGLI